MAKNSQPILARDQSSSGLYKYLKESLIYPEYAYKNKISGIVYVSFTVDANNWVKNHVTNVHVIKSIHSSLDFAAISMVLGIPDKWDALPRGTYDTVRFVYPINFDIETVKPEQISNCFDQRIKELILMDSIILDSMLYNDKPVDRELYILPQLTRDYEKNEKKTSSEYIEIKGTVMEMPEKYPLPMVQVYEIGTNNGTLTDQFGDFSLFINKDSEVKFSCLGYDFKILKFSRTTTDLEIYLDIYYEQMYYSPAYIPKWRRLFKFEN